MATTRVIRHRLLSIVFLGVVTSALSLYALDRAVSTSMSLRRQRAREIVTTEVDRLAGLTPSANLPESVTTYLGVRGGFAESSAALAHAPGLPAEWTAPLQAAGARALAEHRRILVEKSLLPDTLVAAAAPDRSGGLAWIVYLVAPLAALHSWRIVTVALAIATALLVATAVWATLSFRRSAAALHATLNGLGKDLTTPVPQPRAIELGGIADGIRAMAAELLASREATERLGQKLAQKERLAALGRVAAGVAHEVRNPLASIKLRLDLTANTQAVPEAAKRAIAAASDEIARLDRLVSDLLLVAGNQIGRRRPTDLGALCRARLEVLKPWAASRQVSLDSSGDAEAEVDPESVARALDNLLRNAVEASPSGALVQLRVTGSPEAIEVDVEDRGGGVEPARAPELFEPFFTTKAEGTGLGLAISRAIARAHGGEVSYARAGAITRFALTLPRAARSGPAA
ncbi:MAG TPA: ATP-binding protein [Polyangia bacterium]